MRSHRVWFVILVLTGNDAVQPNEVARRNLTLVAKVLQKLGSGLTFKKEPYLADLNPYITANIDTVGQFLDRISVRAVLLCLPFFFADLELFAFVCRSAFR